MAVVSPGLTASEGCARLLLRLSASDLMKKGLRQAWIETILTFPCAGKLAHGLMHALPLPICGKQQQRAYPR